jgi:hypothetical protein
MKGSCEEPGSGENLHENSFGWTRREYQLAYCDIMRRNLRWEIAEAEGCLIILSSGFLDLPEQLSRQRETSTFRAS